MEVDGLGARCALPSCRTLDYLPFTCPSCTLQFCNDHRTPASHACKSAAGKTVPTCPLCSAAVPVPAGSTPDIAVSRHIDAGCPKRKRSNAVCAAHGCNVRDPVSTTCPSCRKVFCLAHRIEATHNCTAVTRGNSAKNVNKGKEKVRKAAKRGSRRTDFLNGPNDPVGDSKVHMDDRMTLAVFFPSGSGIQPRYMFFSRKNSAGKIIDSLRKAISQIPEPDNGERYYLYAVKKGGYGVNLLPYITPLQELGAVLQNGDMLVLETGDQGLDPSWMAALKGTSSSSHGRFFSGKRRGTSSKSGKSGTCKVA